MGLPQDERITERHLKVLIRASGATGNIWLGGRGELEANSLVEWGYLTKVRNGLYKLTPKGFKFLGRYPHL